MRLGKAPIAVRFHTSVQESHLFAAPPGPNVGRVCFPRNHPVGPSKTIRAKRYVVPRASPARWQGSSFGRSRIVYRQKRKHSLKAHRVCANLSSQNSQPCLSLRYETGAFARLGRVICFVPGEERCMCLFEGPSAEAVRQANVRTGLPLERIVEATNISPADLD
jgi:hypothetical protein